ncbi:MAG TPA: hypothetical protein VM715_04660 [Candidatus Acidoferrum sp.]|nr:hypothetical protein [Candidatus Acidoferrum sp.]
MGPNYVLDKGYVVDTVVLEFRAVTLTSNTHVKQSDAAAQFVLGVAQWQVDDTAKIAYGKVTVDVRILGITRAIAGVANIARMQKVGVDALGRITNAGVAGSPALGIAMTPSSQVGDQVDVLLTPGAVV